MGAFMVVLGGAADDSGAGMMVWGVAVKVLLRRMGLRGVWPTNMCAQMNVRHR